MITIVFLKPDISFVSIMLCLIYSLIIILLPPTLLYGLIRLMKFKLDIDYLFYLIIFWSVSIFLFMIIKD